MSEHLPILQPDGNLNLTVPGVDLTESVFLCRKCWRLFDNPEMESEIPCPECENPLPAEPRKHWMVGLCAAQHTELTPELRASRSLPHRRGAQTPEDKYRVSKGNWKHGAYAKRHLLPRAAHGKLAACQHCPFADRDVNPQGDGRCLNQKWVDCAVAAPEIFAFYAARSAGGAEALKEIIGDLNAQQMLLMKLALNEVFSRGIVITERTEKTFENGSSVDERIKLNPAVEATAIFARNLGGTDLNSQQLTPKSQVDGQLTHDLAATLDLLTGRIKGSLAAAAPQHLLPDPSTNTD